MKDLSLHILDIVQNSVRAGAKKILIQVSEDLKNNTYQILIEDDGKGIDPEKLPTITDPWSTSRKTRKVGMGLALFRQNAEQAGGSLTIESELGKGTTVNVCFEYNHIDRPALGDISGVLVQLISSFEKIYFVYQHQTAKDKFIFDSLEIKQSLDGVPLNNPEILKFLKEMINENLEEIGVER